MEIRAVIFQQNPKQLVLKIVEGVETGSVILIWEKRKQVAPRIVDFVETGLVILEKVRRRVQMTVDSVGTAFVTLIKVRIH